MRSEAAFRDENEDKPFELVKERKVMASKLNTTRKITTRQGPRINTTLLELIKALNDVTDNDRLVVATATHLVNFSHTRLTGSIKNGRVVIG
jgi:hypothetical protein